MSDETTLKDCYHAARFNLRELVNRCHVNEAEFSGWGEMVVPEGAIDATKKAQQALTMLEEIKIFNVVVEGAGK